MSYLLQVPVADSNKESENKKLKSVLEENDNLKKEIEEKKSKLLELEGRRNDTGLSRELSRLKTRYDNLEREKDMVVTEKLAMETEQVGTKLLYYDCSLFN